MIKSKLKIIIPISILIVLLFITIALFLSGKRPNGEYDNTVVNTDDNKFIVIYSNESAFRGNANIFRIIVDSDTGVEYIGTFNNNGSNLTPRLDADGKPIIYKIKK